jgi:hypothetical protein
MSNNNNAIVAAALGSSGTKRVSRRVLAEAISVEGRKTKYYLPTGKKHRKEKIMAMQLWSAVTEGKVSFADGREMVVNDIRDWKEMVAFLSNHLDGPAKEEAATFNGVNLFKVYVDLDTDLV